jgi:hypothetical protein
MQQNGASVDGKKIELILRDDPDRWGHMEPCEESGHDIQVMACSVPGLPRLAMRLPSKIR